MSKRFTKEEVERLKKQVASRQFVMYQSIITGGRKQKNKRKKFTGKR